MKKTLLSICFFASALLANAQSPIFQWAKHIGGTAQDKGSNLMLDESGNVYTIGSFNGTVDFDPGAGTFNLTSGPNGDLFISKSDASGSLMWAKNVGGSSTSVIAGNYIKIDGSGNLYIIGSFNGTVDFDPGNDITNLTSAGNSDIFILKLDGIGNFAWAKKMGGTLDDEGRSITTDVSGNVYVTGAFQLTTDFDPGVGTFNLTSAGAEDIFISKLDASGNFVWAKSIGGTAYDSGNSIVLDASGNVYTTGSFNGTVDFNPGAGTFNLISGNDEIFISKLDASGNFVWAKNMSGTSFSFGSAIALDASGNIYTTGQFNGTVDFDPGAGTFSFTAPGNFQIFISKLDASGNFVWAKNMEGTSDASGNSIMIDAPGNVYTSGSFNGSVDFDPGAGIVGLTSAGGSDIFISKLDASGNFVWAKSIGGIADESGHSIVDASANIYTIGSFYGTVDFDPGPATFNLTSAGDYDIFIQKMNQATVGINENANIDNITIYPNPANGLFNIVISAPIKNVCIEIYNSTGVLVYTKTSVNEKNTIEFTNQANDIYFVKVMNDNKIIASQKIIKQ